MQTGSQGKQLTGPRDGQAVTEARQWRRRVEIRRPTAVAAAAGIFVPDGGLLHVGVGGGEQVGPNPRHVGALDAAAFVRDFDDHVFVAFAVGHHHSNWWRVLITVKLNGGPHRVLQQLQQDVVQVGRHVRKG